MKKLLPFLCIISFPIISMQQQLFISGDYSGKTVPNHILLYRPQNQTENSEYTSSDRFTEEYNQIIKSTLPIINECKDPELLKISLLSLKSYCNNFDTRSLNIKEIKDAAQIALDKSKNKSIKASTNYAQTYILNPLDSAGVLKDFGDAQLAYYNAYLNKEYAEVFDAIIQQPTESTSYVFDFVQLDADYQQFKKYKELRNYVIWNLFSTAKTSHIQTQLDKLRTHCNNFDLKPRNIEIKAAAQIILDNQRAQVDQANIIYTQEKELDLILSEQPFLKYADFQRIAYSNKALVDNFGSY